MSRLLGVVSRLLGVLAGLYGLCYAQSPPPPLPPPSSLPLPSPPLTAPADWVRTHRMGERGGWSLEPSRGDEHLKAPSAEHLFEAYAEFHTRAIALTRNTGAPLPPVLICEPMYGLGNRMRAMMGCFTIALASKRLMFVDWNHKYTFWMETEHRDMPGGQPAALEQLWQPPGFDWSLDTFHDLLKLNGKSLNKNDVFHISEQLNRDEVLACQDLQLAWNLQEQKYATFKTYFWWDLILHNHYYETTLARVLGRDSMGVIRAWEKLAPLLLKPVAEVTEMVEALESLMLPAYFRMGLHVRMGMNWFDQADQELEEGQSRSQERSDLAVHTAKCAMGVIPHDHRDQPLTWIIVSDNSQAKTIAR